MSDSVRPHRWQPPRLPRLWDSPGKNTGVGCHFLLQRMKVKVKVKVKVKLLSCVWPSATLWTEAFQAPLSMGFSRQEYWSGVPLPSPASVWDECTCAVVWAFFGIAFLKDWNENWPFPVLWPLLSFPNLLAYWVQHFHSIFHIAQTSVTLSKENSHQKKSQLLTIK